VTEDLLAVIAARRSSRGRFDPGRRVDERDVVRIVEAARWAPTAHNQQNFELVIVDDPAVIDELGELRAPVSRAYVEDTLALCSWSLDELFARRVGVLGTEFPPAWHGSEPDDARRLAASIAGAPLLIFVLHDPSRRPPGTDLLGPISLGCVLENMWLAATAAGLDVQLLTTITEADVADEIARVLRVPASLRVAFALRVGHALSPTTPARVRREARAIVHRNRCG
jgi:nitroreductase